MSKCGEDHLFNYFFPIFHPELPFLATVSRPDNENRETASEIPARCLRSQYKRSRGERSGFAFTLGHFICLAPELPPLSAMSPPSTSAHLFRWNTFMQSVKVPPHLFHSSTVPQCSAFSQLHFPYMVNRENFAAATTIHVFFTHYDEKYAGGAICVGGVVSPQNKHTCASHSLGYHN